jgi:hypothetical protein
MSNRDHFQKPPTNEEKIGMLLKNINQIYQILGDINARLIALSRSKLPAADLAKFMKDKEQNGIYMKNLNSSLDYEAAQEAKKQDSALSAFKINDTKPLASPETPTGNK